MSTAGVPPKLPDGVGEMYQRLLKRSKAEGGDLCPFVEDMFVNPIAYRIRAAAADAQAGDSIFGQMANMEPIIDALAAIDPRWAQTVAEYAGFVAAKSLPTLGEHAFREFCQSIGADTHLAGKFDILDRYLRPYGKPPRLLTQEQFLTLAAKAGPDWDLADHKSNVIRSILHHYHGPVTAEQAQGILTSIKSEGTGKDMLAVELERRVQQDSGLRLPLTPEKLARQVEKQEYTHMAGGGDYLKELAEHYTVTAAQALALAEARGTMGLSQDFPSEVVLYLVNVITDPKTMLTLISKDHELFAPANKSCKELKAKLKARVAATA